MHWARQLAPFAKTWRGPVARCSRQVVAHPFHSFCSVRVSPAPCTLRTRKTFTHVHGTRASRQPGLQLRWVFAMSMPHAAAHVPRPPNRRCVQGLLLPPSSLTPNCSILFFFSQPRAVLPTNAAPATDSTRHHDENERPHVISAMSTAEDATAAVSHDAVGISEVKVRLDEPQRGFVAFSAAPAAAAPQPLRRDLNPAARRNAELVKDVSKVHDTIFPCSWATA